MTIIHRTFDILKFFLKYTNLHFFDKILLKLIIFSLVHFYINFVKKINEIVVLGALSCSASFSTTTCFCFSSMLKTINQQVFFALSSTTPYMQIAALNVFYDDFVKQMARERLGEKMQNLNSRECRIKQAFLINRFWFNTSVCTRDFLVKDVSTKLS